MKKTVLKAVLLLCFTALVNSVHAQEKLEAFMSETTPEERAQLQTDYMKENLVLTDVQLPKVQSINLKYAQKMQDAYNSGERKLQKVKRMKSIGADKDKEMKGVLTSDQYATYEKNKEAMKEKIREKAKKRKS